MAHLQFAYILGVKTNNFYRFVDESVQDVLNQKPKMYLTLAILR